MSRLEQQICTMQCIVFALQQKIVLRKFLYNCSFYVGNSSAGPGSGVPVGRPGLIEASDKTLL
eukprot:3705612-Rhodomonas_salina.1